MVTMHLTGSQSRGWEQRLISYNTPGENGKGGGGGEIVLFESQPQTPCITLIFQLRQDQVEQKRVSENE